MPAKFQIKVGIISIGIIFHCFCWIRINPQSKRRGESSKRARGKKAPTNVNARYFFCAWNNIPNEIIQAANG